MYIYVIRIISNLTKISCSQNTTVCCCVLTERYFSYDISTVPN